jgi:hypothetical protein
MTHMPAKIGDSSALPERIQRQNKTAISILVALFGYFILPTITYDHALNGIRTQTVPIWLLCCH